MSERPLVVLGFDVGDADLIERWADQGRMPTAARVLSRGCRARTGGAELMTEHGVWVPMASGISRARHGYYQFRQLVPGTYDLRPTTARDFDVAPLWAGLAGSTKRVVAIDVPDARPVAAVDGVQLCNWATHQPKMTRAAPAALPESVLARARSAYGRFEPTWEFAADATVADDRAALAALLDRIGRKSAMCRSLLRDADPDLVFVTFAESHPAGHRFWRYRREEGGASGLSDAIGQVYTAIDRAMGEILAEVGGDPNVVLLSTVGMADAYPTPELTEGLLRLLGHQAAPGKSGEAGTGLLARLATRIPEPLRARIAARLPDDLAERRLADRFRAATDWSRTTAFAIPGLHNGFVRVNLRGREPEGTVEPGAEYESLLDSIEDELARLVDPVLERPAVARVRRTARLTDRHAPHHLPDLVVEWASAPRFIERLVHPRGDVRQQRLAYCPDSFHTLSGLFAACGPSVAARGDLGEIDVLDVAPTCLGLIGEPAGEHMTGRELFPHDPARA